MFKRDEHPWKRDRSGEPHTGDVIYDANGYVLKDCRDYRTIRPSWHESEPPDRASRSPLNAS